MRKILNMEAVDFLQDTAFNVTAEVGDICDIDEDLDGNNSDILEVKHARYTGFLPRRIVIELETPHAHG